MEKQVILNATQLELTLKRLSHELIETHNNFENSILIGLQPRGIHVTTRIKAQLEAILTQPIQAGNLDITFHRDDFRRRETPLLPSITNIDVLFTGRTIRAGLDALLTFGRPSQVQLLALIDRRFSRDLPIQADYIGKTVDTLASERVAVEWNEIEGQDQVLLFTKEGNEAAQR
jgi:pyrimidine operon attenuation protein/uracil phosphoribosyltransferase